MAGKEIRFLKSEVIVSKTDLQGRITYVNDIFCKVSNYTENELLGKPHSIIRHKNMPRCVFKLLWETVSKGQEIFAYVVNTTKDGDYYWVLAHVTPTFNAQGQIIGYHSNRRLPSMSVVKNTIEPLYKQLIEAENEEGRKNAPQAGFDKLVEILENAGVTYDEFVLKLAKEHVE